MSKKTRLKKRLNPKQMRIRKARRARKLHDRPYRREKAFLSWLEQERHLLMKSKNKAIQRIANQTEESRGKSANDAWCDKWEKDMTKICEKLDVCVKELADAAPTITDFGTRRPLSIGTYPGMGRTFFLDSMITLRHGQANQPKIKLSDNSGKAMLNLGTIHQHFPQFTFDASDLSKSIDLRDIKPPVVDGEQRVYVSLDEMGSTADSKNITDSCQASKAAKTITFHRDGKPVESISPGMIDFLQYGEKPGRDIDADFQTLREDGRLLDQKTDALIAAAYEYKGRNPLTENYGPIWHPVEPAKEVLAEKRNRTSLLRRIKIRAQELVADTLEHVHKVVDDLVSCIRG